MRYASTRHDLSALILGMQTLEPEHARTWESWVSELNKQNQRALQSFSTISRGLVAYGALENRNFNAKDDEVAHCVRYSIAEALATLRALYPEMGSHQRLRSASGTSPSEKAMFVNPSAEKSQLDAALAEFLRIAEGISANDIMATASVESLLHSVDREFARCVFFKPTDVLEFRLGLDRLSHGQMSTTLQSVSGVPERTVLSVIFLSLSRIRRELSTVEQLLAANVNAASAEVVLASIRRDLRGMSRFLLQQGIETLAEGLHDLVLSTPASDIEERSSEIERAANATRELKRDFESIATRLQTDVRASIDQLHRGLSFDAAASRIAEARKAIDSIVSNICSTIAPQSSQDDVAFISELHDDRASLLRQRRDLWMFSHVLRAFVHKASVTRADASSWVTNAESSLVESFFRHYRSLGYQVIVDSSYPHADSLLACIDASRSSVHLRNDALQRLVSAIEKLIPFLEAKFREIESGPLRGSRLDRQAAAVALRAYLVADAHPRSATAAAGAFGLGSSSNENALDYPISCE